MVVALHANDNHGNQHESNPLASGGRQVVVAAWIVDVVGGNAPRKDLGHAQRGIGIIGLDAPSALSFNEFELLSSIVYSWER